MIFADLRDSSPVFNGANENAYRSWSWNWLGKINRYVPTTFIVCCLKGLVSSRSTCLPTWINMLFCFIPGIPVADIFVSDRLNLATS